ncbi:iron complex transport system substrate-binding protein [Staphylococcus auricularis]|uniref:ABC transporter substrate-binding protein n=1 Tax=Staphylococcus auricularis TaxID=29379 RepID=A0AAP8TTR3_9STAP|nr:ABC transporter substrate-binding protein [Staphylococcus auricularis]MBM0867457.1 ABC transporter substrate-binding protein [Staphylococcus auricularis]MCG7341559.1 ABC transporter substrate-binding protein [Staphylococcus auricularis]MDC6327726.1 ABC transporter substrate-binding protein [Staphylococcus auricularis]MDN4533678.1 ABC transporter substrate-binding protein [Staphylococcus auricularis]PNZ68823.1 ABC transporter substrate-binding protein [Staphylococcus auricularis]
MKHKILYVLIACILVLSACGGNDSNEQSKSESSSSDASYHRIISLMPSNTEILYELGLKDDIIGVSTVDDYPKDVKNKDQFDAMELNKEALLKAKPDLILAHESQKSTAGETLKSVEDSGVKVVYIKDAQSIDEMYQTFNQVGKVTGKEKESKALVEETKSNINKVIDSVPENDQGQSVFMEVSSEPEIYTSGKGTFFDDMLKQLKAENSFSNLDSWQKVSKEDIIRKDPDVLVSTSGMSQKEYKDVIDKRGGFDQIKAVKNDHIEAVNGDQISRPGPRIDDGLKALRDAIYD